MPVSTFVTDAFSIHVSAPADSESSKPARSLLNFHRLLQKHPSLAVVAPAWVRSTYERIVTWCERWDVDIEQERHGIEPLLPAASALRGSLIRADRPRLRVLTYRWHVPHQYELWKLPIDVTMVTGTGSPMSDQWDYDRRPLPDNARFRALEDIDPRDYDVAILHFDENVLTPENTNGVIGLGMGCCLQTLLRAVRSAEGRHLSRHASVSRAIQLRLLGARPDAADRAGTAAAG